MPETPTHHPVRAMLDERSRDLDLDPTMPPSVGRRSRRRRWLTATAAGAGATTTVIAAILVVGAVTGPSNEFVDNTQTPNPVPTQSVSPAPSPTASATGEPVAYPSTYVAVIDERLVRVDTFSGEIVEELLPGTRIDGPISVAADGVYYQDEWLPQISYLPFGSSEPELVVDGINPAISPDGQRLAYGRLSDDLPAECTEFCTDLVIRDLATGEEIVWGHGEDVTQTSFTAWLPGDGLAVSVSPFGDGDTVLKVVSANEGGRLDQVDPIMQPELDGPNWRVAGYHEPTGGLLVTETCCFYYGEGPRWAVRSVDPDTGAVLETFSNTPNTTAFLDSTGTVILLRVTSETDGTIGRMVVIGPNGTRTDVMPTEASWIDW